MEAAQTFWAAFHGRISAAAPGHPGALPAELIPLLCGNGGGEQNSPSI